MDGLGEGGSITGEASTARGAVVFREALELALYTFRYLPDAEGVMVMIPPPPTDPAEAAEVAAATAKAATDPEAAAKVAEAQAKAKAKYRALYFRPGDLKSELQIPLGVTVPAGAPNADTITKAEEDDINQRVRSNLFTWEQNPQTGASADAPLALTFGLCADCARQRVIRNTRGSVFSMCERGLAGEPGYAKYPPMPVVRCAGFEPRYIRR